MVPLDGITWEGKTLQWRLVTQRNEAHGFPF